MKQAEKGIRFITPNYEEKFRIADGDKVRIITKGGERREMICRYIDDYHMEAGSYRGENLYHICDLQNGWSKQNASPSSLSELPFPINALAIWSLREK